MNTDLDDAAGLGMYDDYYPPSDLAAAPHRRRLKFAIGLVLLVAALGIGILWTEGSARLAALRAENTRLQEQVALLSSLHRPGTGGLSSANGPDALPEESDARPAALDVVSDRLGPEAAIPLRVFSSPSGAEVSIDGIPVGTTPLTDYRVPPGAYIVSAAKADLGREEKVVTLMPSDEAHTVEFELDVSGLAPEDPSVRHEPTHERRPGPDWRELVSRAASRDRANPPSDSKPASGAAEAETVRRGRLTVTSSPPGADVLLSGRVVGRTPLALEDLKAGTYTLVVKKEGHKVWTTQVPIVQNQPLQLKAKLSPEQQIRKPGW